MERDVDRDAIQVTEPDMEHVRSLLERVAAFRDCSEAVKEGHYPGGPLSAPALVRVSKNGFAENRDSSSGNFAPADTWLKLMALVLLLFLLLLGVALLLETMGVVPFLVARRGMLARNS